MKLRGLIPARSGSKRVPGKNTRLLGGHPVIAYTIRAAQESGIFDELVVSTEDEATAEIARAYGASVPFLRPAEMAADHSPDIDWILYTLRAFRDSGNPSEAFAILRPTSPFRTPDTFRRAWQAFSAAIDADSLRAVEPCHQHPGKMWTEEAGFLRPLLDDGGARPPWHSSATQSLPPVFAQNASLEIAWERVPFDAGTIAGNRIVAFHTEGYEGYDINKPDDFLFAEMLLERGLVQLPAMTKPL